MRWSSLLIIGLFISYSSHSLQAQKTRLELENEKSINLSKIADAERILKQTAAKKEATIGELQALNQQIIARERLTKSLKEEINLLDIEVNELDNIVKALNDDLQRLKKDYSQQIYSTYKSTQGYDRLMFLFSSEGFNQFFYRLKYLEQYAKARRMQAEQIEQVTLQIYDRKSQLETKRKQQEILFHQEVKEDEKLSRSRKEQERLISKLVGREGQLKSEIRKRRAENDKFNRLIADFIKKEDIKNAKASNADIADANELTRSFESQRNKLIWPVPSGFIASKFGSQPHPVLKKITVINDGIGIQTEKNSKVFSVYDGEVKMTGAIPGKNSFVLIRHGNYLTVYARLKTINVTKGQRLAKGDVIGTVYTDREGLTQLEFQVYKGASKLDPEQWLAMK